MFGGLWACRGTSPHINRILTTNTRFTLKIGSTPYAPNELEAEHEKLRRKGLHPPKKCNFPKGYIKNDQRPSIRVNRAGTRGFRAPEVLFKVHRQTIGALLCHFSETYSPV